MAKDCGGSTTLFGKDFSKKIVLFFYFVVVMDIYTYSESAWVPFYDIEFLVIFVLVTVALSVFFLFNLKKLITGREEKILVKFFDMLDSLCLNDDQKNAVKIFTVIYNIWNRYSSFLWFAVKDTLSPADNNFVESIMKRLFPSHSDEFKDFLKQHEEDYKIYKEISNKISFLISRDILLVVLILLFVLLIILSVFSLCVFFYLR